MTTWLMRLSTFWGFVIAMTALFLRRSSSLLAPQFFAEDGAIFFADALKLSVDVSLFKPFAGYLHLFPRLVAELVSGLPIVVAPFAYHLVSLICGAACISFVLSNRLERAFGILPWRVCLFLFLLAGPNHEHMMRLAYIQWYLLLWLVLVSVADTPRTNIARVGTLVGVFITGLSAPLAVIVVPLLCGRIWFSRLRKAEIVFSLFMLLAALLSASTQIATNYTLAPVQRALVASSDNWLAVTQLLVFKIFGSSIFGVAAAHTLLQSGWVYLYTLAACGVFILLCSTFVAYRNFAMQLLLGWYVLFFCSFSVILRPEILKAALTPAGVSGHDRYFWLPAAAATLIVLCGLRALVSRPVKFSALSFAMTPDRAALILAVLLLVIHAPGFRRRSSTPIDFDWHTQAQVIDAWEHSAKTEKISLPINPKPWRIQL